MEPSSHRNQGRILLIYPQTRCQLGSADIQGGGVSLNRLVPPLGLLYIATALLKEGYDVKFIDFSVDTYSLDKLHKLIKDIDLVGISVLGENRIFALQLAKDIKGFDRNVQIIFGGPEITMNPELSEEVDAIVLGEAESQIVSIVNCLLSGKSLSDCNGVIYKDGRTGEAIKTSFPLVERDLNSIEFPARELVNRSKYTVFAPFFRGKWASIITSRGCPSGCIFCSWPSSKFHPYRSRSADNVIKEIQSIYKDGYRFLYVVDSNFLVDLTRAKLIAEGVIQSGIDLRMTILGRVDSANKELYIRLREAGVRIIGFGLESGDQETLNYLNKNTTVEQNRYAVELTNQCGMYSHGHFMIGVPNETRTHIERTISFAKSIPLDTAFFHLFTIRKGSTLWNKFHTNGLIESPEDGILATRERGLGNLSKDELIDLQRKAYKEYYGRPSFWIRQLKKAIHLRDSRFTLLTLAAGVAFFRQKTTYKIQKYFRKPVG